MTNIKKALVIIPRMPFPLNSGGRIAIYETIKTLSQEHELIVIIIDDRKDNERYLAEINKFSEEVYFITKSKISFIKGAILGLLSGMPLQVGYFYLKDVQKLVDRLYLKCDILIAFMIRTTTYGLNLNIKKMHYAIDSMYLNYKKSEANTTSLLWKFIYKIEIPLLYKTELNQIKNYNLTTFVNREETLFWESHGNVKTLPHGIEMPIFSYDKHDDTCKNVVAFVGRMDYQPNIEAVVWFCENVLNSLSKEIEFWIIGGFPTAAVLNLKNQYKNVKVLGFVDDPYIILKSCICAVAPMRSGGGLQTKILMAMALECIVISTSLPVGAIESAEHGKNILVEDNPLGIATYINAVYENPKQYLGIKKAAKKLVMDTYALNVINEKLFTLIKNI